MTWVIIMLTDLKTLTLSHSPDVDIMFWSGLLLFIPSFRVALLGYTLDTGVEDPETVICLYHCV